MKNSLCVESPVSRFAAIFIAALLIFTSPALAEDFPEVDADQARKVIEQQLEAFAADDQAKAFSFAAPLIKNSFGTPETFMEMVKQGYQPVFRNQSYSFEENFIDQLGRPSLRFRIVDLDGKSFDAVYTMELQPDGTWKISGCVLLRLPETGAILSITSETSPNTQIN